MEAAKKRFNINTQQELEWKKIKIAQGRHTKDSEELKKRRTIEMYSSRVESTMYFDFNKILGSKALTTEELHKYIPYDRKYYDGQQDWIQVEAKLVPTIADQMR